ncbi:MAG TPA: T9SS type A sorting domain-containing protein, partial [Paludibacteraceae bacterium]|nr:T9SS type A sorting domain-containing protein [Paludibacteraceae bacterium]
PVMNDTIQRFTTRLVTETEVPALAPRLMRTTTGIRVELTEPANIELYNINGSLIEKTKATGTYTRDLNNGIYIIRINGKSTKFVK